MWAFLFPVAALNVAANILLKLGAGDRAAICHVLSLRSFFGLCLFGIGGLAYAWLLKRVPLGVAQAVLASQYIFTVLGACFLLHEQISRMQFLGFALIAAGIFCVIWK